MKRPSVRLREDRSSEYHGVLVYDGECPFCSAAATALRRVPGVGAISHSEGAARRFLEAQFADVPFALVFADASEGRVYVGREVARELCDRVGLPLLASDLVGENYESIADAVRTVAGVDREPDPYHDVLPTTDGAAESFSELADAAVSTSLVAFDRASSHSSSVRLGRAKPPSVRDTFNLRNRTFHLKKLKLRFSKKIV